MKVRYTPQAKADLSEIFSYVAKDNPAAASRLIARICHHVVALSNNPALGRAGRIAGTRELIIPRYPYIAAYRIHGDAVEVLAIVHTSRSWPEVF